MKKMKLKKPKRVNFIVFLIIICILFLVVNFLLKKIELNSNELFVKRLLQKSNYYLINENLDTNLTYKLFKFDLKNPKGKNIVLNLNGAKADYMAPVKDGDVIDLYWED